MTNRNKITVTAAEIIAASDGRPATSVRVRMREERATASSSDRMSWLWLTASLPVPFLNAWVWYRHSRHRVQDRRFFVVLAVLFACLSILAGTAAAVYVFGTRVDWIESLNRCARYGVVQVFTEQGSGTGIVIASKDGRHLILTNRHVVSVEEGFSIFTNTVIPDEVQCRLRSGAQITASLAGLPISEDLDLALLVVASDELAPLGTIRPFAETTIGEEVVAIGHPMGFEWTFTKGIISGLRWGYCLQTDAAINSGNSGGPLIDRHGRIIGVNTMRLADQAAQGLNFALRADLVLEQERWSYRPNVKIDDLLNELQ